MAEPSARSAVGDAGSEDQAAANRRGIVAVTGAMAIYTVSDVMVKLTSDANSTYQIMVLRGVAAILATFVMIVALGQLRRLPLAFTKMIVLRSFLDAGATWCFLRALKEIPLADATTILLAAPLIMMPLAVFILKEKVGLRRWLATVVGFAGVLLVMQPQGDWKPASLFAVLCCAFIAAREIMTRRLPPGAPTLTITLLSAMAITFVGAVGAVSEGWKPMEALPVWILIGAGVLNAWGNYLNAHGFRIGQSSAVAPFRYSTIPLAFAAGYVIWDQIPTLSMATGALLILGAGLVVLRGESGRK